MQPRAAPVLALLVGTLVPAGACAPEPATFTLAFSFAEEPSLPPQAHVRARLTGPDDDGERTLAVAGPLPFPSSGAEPPELSFPEVPNGERRVITAEITDGPGATAPVLYYGVSKPFTLRPGEDVVVEVELQLRGVPRVGEDASAVAIVAPEGEAVVEGALVVAPVVGGPGVRLALVSDTGVGVRVASTLDAVDGADVLTLDDMAAGGALADGREVRLLDWDLDDGGEPCPVSDRCAREVFVRFVDERGYESAVTSAQVNVDTQPPAIVGEPPELVLESDLSCPVADVDALAPGGRLFFSVVTSEPLGAPPVATSLPAGGLECGVEVGDGAFFLLSCACPAAGCVEGSYSLRLRLVDEVGNATGDGDDATSWLEVSDAPVEVKGAEPVLVVAQDEVVFLRSPVGNLRDEDVASAALPAGAFFGLAPPAIADESAPSGAITAGAFTFEGGGAPTLLRVFADPEKETLLGEVVPNADGTWPLTALAPVDVAGVFVSGFDDACRESAVAKVQHGQWVMTTNRLPFGGDVLSLSAGPAGAPPREAVDGAVRSDERDRTVVQGLDTSTLRPSVPLAWQRRNAPLEAPPARALGAATLDVERGRVVLFGGGLSGGGVDTVTDDVWEWDGVRWQAVEPLGGDRPAPRLGASFVFDLARGVALLFGGHGGFLDTWSWDGTRWTQLSDHVSGLPQQDPPVVVYDGGRSQAVLLAVDSDEESIMMRWTGAQWSEMPVVLQPPPRRYAAMAYDPGRDVVVLFGGEALDGTALSDTWEWNGASWSEPVLDGATPSARSLHALAYDAARGEVVLVGGLGASHDAATRKGDAWSFDGARWQELAPAGPRPPARHGVALSSDADGGVLAFGGSEGGLYMDPVLGDTWHLDEAGFLDVDAAATHPPARTGAAVAYDAARGVVVLFGGRRHPQFTLLGDTWEWDGRRWWQRSPSASPPARTEHGMAYDATRGKVVLFGGDNGSRLNDTWEWDGAANTWTPASPTASPSARDQVAMTPAPGGGVLLFGGNTAAGDSDETWVLNGSTWDEVTPAGASPPPRVRHEMAFDASRNVVVMYGGRISGSAQDDLWEWDGSAWADETPGLGEDDPRRLDEHAMVYDPVRQRVLFVAETPELWSWDGDTFEILDVLGPRPGARLDPLLAFDEARGELVFLDAAGLTTGAPETWTLAPAGSGVPAVRLSLSVAASGLQLAAIEEMHVRAYAAGGTTSSTAPGARVSAYRFRGADAGSWIPLGENARAAPAGNLPLSIAESRFDVRLDDLTPWLQGAAQRLHVEVSARDGSGPVALDYLELRFSYVSP